MVCRGAIRAGHNPWLNRLTSAPNVSSATARLRAFSGGYRDSFRLTVVSHPKARSRPASAYRPSRRHVGGDGFKRWPAGHHDAGTSSHNLRRDGFGERIHRMPEKAPSRLSAPAPCGLASNPQDARSATAIAWYNETEFFGFRIQPPLPRWLAPKSVCQWFHHSQGNAPPPVRRFP